MKTGFAYIKFRTIIYFRSEDELMEERDLSTLLSNMADLGIEIKEQPTEEVIEISSKRSLRKRSASEDSLLHKVRNRKTMKPKRNANGALQFETEKEVKNFYLNINKKVKLKPALLETIFEDDETVLEDEEEASTSSGSVGKKMKRILTITNGLNSTKMLKDKRKNLIKKHLGGKKRPKKIALAKFMEYFKQQTVEEVEVPAVVFSGELELLPS